MTECPKCEKAGAGKRDESDHWFECYQCGFEWTMGRASAGGIMMTKEFRRKWKKVPWGAMPVLREEPEECS